MDTYLMDSVDLLQDQILQGLTKDILIKYISDEKVSLSKKREVLIEYVKGACETNKSLLRRIYEENCKVFGLSPYQLELGLKITKAERKRWGSDGRLIIISYTDVEKYGKLLQVPLYDMAQYFYLKNNTEVINGWRIADKEVGKCNRKNGAVKAQETKLKRNILRNVKQKEIEDMIEGWQAIDYDMCQVMKLAYWTLWVSRLAKHYQVKASNAKSKAMEYTEKKVSFYLLKNEAMILLAKTPYAKVSFYRPQFCNKYSHVVFCKKHYELYLMESAEYSEPKYEFIHRNRDELLQCQECDIEEKKDYYSLYYLEITDSRIPDYCLSFHTPYDIGFLIWGDPALLKQVHHQENDGMFRFGRTLFDDEEIVYTDKYVTENFRKSFECVRHLY